jgi:hypothetical protein
MALDQEALSELLDALRAAAILMFSVKAWRWCSRR